jgi:Putative Actinobacterial Holin-X, holin superfamily III
MNDETSGSPASSSAGRLAVQLGVQAAALVGQEIALAHAELRATGRQAVKGGLAVAGAAAVGATAWLAGVAAAIIGISEALPSWAAALIVATALALLGGVLAVTGGRRLSRVPRGLPLTTTSIRQGLHEIAQRAKE